MAVNTRCFGIFLGLLVGWVSIPYLKSIIAGRRWPMWILAVAVILQIIDFSGNMAGLWENTNHSRAIFGLILGVSVPVAIADLFYLQRKNN